MLVNNGSYVMLGIGSCWPLASISWKSCCSWFKPNSTDFVRFAQSLPRILAQYSVIFSMPPHSYRVYRCCLSLGHINLGAKPSPFIRFLFNSLISNTASILVTFLRIQRLQGGWFKTGSAQPSNISLALPFPLLFGETRKKLSPPVSHVLSIFPGPLKGCSNVSPYELGMIRGGI